MRNQLPPQAQQPVLTVQVGQTIDAMYMGFFSDVLPSNNVTDYLLRVVKPKLDSLEGVQTAEILGGRQFALRAWLDPDAAGRARRDGERRLHGAGQPTTTSRRSARRKGTDGQRRPERGHRPAFGRRLQATRRQAGDGSIVRLEDVANVVLGADNYDFNVAFSGSVRRVHRHQGGADAEHPRCRAQRQSATFPGCRSSSRPA